MLTDCNEEIVSQVKETFNNAQFGLASHRKLIQSLRTLLLECSSQEGSEGERSFFLAIIHCLNTLLVVKRAEDVVNRCIRFLVGFMVMAAEKDEARVVGGDAANSPVVRFIENVMMYALEGVDSKERLVRIRLAQLLVAGVNALDELSDGVWKVFRVKMTERLFDKEAAVRVQAVHAMARLQSMSLTASLENEVQLRDTTGLTVLDVFLDLLTHDHSVEVRKAVLHHIEVNERTLPAILQRSRDVDASLRRLLYERKLGTNGEVDVRMLSIKQRDQLLKTGLRDRDATVRRACVQMVFGSWIRTTNNNLILLLLSLDVIRNEEVAVAALGAFYELVPDIFKEGFPPAYFDNLTPETVIALRVYCERQASGKPQETGLELEEWDGRLLQDPLQDLLPELSQMAHHIRTIYLGHLGNEADGRDLETRAEDDFIIRELFRVTKLLDLSDEMGRRVMQDLLIEMLANLQVSDTVFNDALQLLIHLTPTLEDFFRACGQLIADLHELGQSTNTINGEESSEQLCHSLETFSLKGDNNDNKQYLINEDVRILALLRGQLLVAAAFSLPNLATFSHPVLLDLLNDAVIPAINSSYAAVQTCGLQSLGLAALLSKDLASEYSSLFVEFYRQGHDEVRLVALQIIFDLLLTDDYDECKDEKSSELERKSINLVNDVVSSLYDANPEIQTIATRGFSKLLLHRRCLNDAGAVLVGLFQLYYHPATVNNLSLRQSLTYFFQAFAYSAAQHQLMIAEAFIPIMEAWWQAHGGGNEVTTTGLELTPLQVASQLLDLTNPINLIPEARQQEISKSTLATCYSNPHAIIGEAAAWSALHYCKDIRGRAKLYAQIFTRINVDSILGEAYSITLIKRLLFVGGQLLRILGETGTAATNTTSGGLDKVTQTAIKRIIARLVELDDPTIALTTDDLTQLRAKLDECQLPDRASQSLAINAANTVMKRNHRAPDTSTMVNYVEDLDDLRD